MMMILGPLVFLVIVHFIGPDTMDQPVYSYIGVIFALMGVISSLVLPRIVLSARKPATPREKARSYVTVKITQMGPVEAGALANGVFYYLTGDQTTFVIAIILILLTAYFRPSTDDFKNLMNADDRDINQLI